MAILVGSDTRLIVQGITGRDGSLHTGQMLSYGTRVVRGIGLGAAKGASCRTTSSRPAVLASSRARARLHVAVRKDTPV